MKRLIVSLVSAVTLLVLVNGVQAQDQLVPAGTLLQWHYVITEFLVGDGVGG